MEEGVSTRSDARDLFSGAALMEEKDISQLSPLTLSLIGDAVFELYIRMQTLLGGTKKADTLHHKKTDLVNAKAQAGLLKKIDASLTEEERDIVRRGRNAKHHSTAKNQTVSDYNQASGLEALCGYLYLKGDTMRLQELLWTDR